MQCNDELASIETTAFLNIGFENSLDAEFQQCGLSDSEYPYDRDWFRVDLEEGRTYLFKFDEPHTNNSSVALGIYDDEARQRVADDLSQHFYDLHFLRYTPRRTGTYYLEVDQFSGPFSNYTIAAREINTDNISADGQFIRSFNGITKADEISTVGEVDRFKIRFKKSEDIHYRISVVGSDGGGGRTLADPFLRAGQLVDDDSGVGRSASLIYQPNEIRGGNGFYLERTILVEGKGGTGSYTISVNTVDKAGVGQGNAVELEWTSPLRHEANTAEFGLVKNHFLDSKNDIDWFKIELEAGSRYRFQLLDPTKDTAITGRGEGNILPTLLLRDTENNVVKHAFVSDFSKSAATIDYIAPVSGSYYLVARNGAKGEAGEHRLTARRFKRHRLELASDLKPQGRFMAVDGEERLLNSMFNLGGLDIDQSNAFEIYSDLELEFEGQAKPANRVYRVATEDIGEWKYAMHGSRHRHDILVRAKLGSRWSPWLHIPIKALSTNRPLNSGVKWDSNELITYRFVNELPGYYGVDEIEGFQPVDPNLTLASKVRQRLELFYASSNVRLREALSEEVDAEINIFIADQIDGHYMAFKPGPDRGGDIILSSNFYQSDSLVSVEGEFNLLRASGETLGLNPVANVDWDKSVMGVAQADEPLMRFTPSLHDLVVLDQLYGPPPTQSGFRTNLRSAGSGFPPVLETQRLVDTIQAGSQHGSLVGRRFFIDLREGTQSYTEINRRQSYTLVNAVGSIVRDVIGSPVRDFVIGNHIKNNISAGAGFDYIEGLEGDDILEGDGGNDRFAYNFGDGDDIVSGGYGVDSIRFKSKHIFKLDELWNDFTFKRKPSVIDPRRNDLLIELTLDGGASEGSVLLKEMSETIHRTETLILENAAGNLKRISLVNLFDQLDFSRSQFNFAAGADDYGQLVAPI